MPRSIMIQHPEARLGRSCRNLFWGRTSRPAAHPRPAGNHGCYTKGRGQLKIRAKTKREQLGKDRESDHRHGDSVPGKQVAADRAVSALVNEKKIEGISDIRDESDRDGLRIVFELKRGEQPEVVLNNLYKHTQLQISFGIIMLSIVNGQPREFGLLPMHQVLHRSSGGSGPPAHGVRTAQGARARAHFARLPEGAGPPGRSDPADPRRGESARKRAKP